MDFELTPLQADAVLAALQHHSAFLLAVRQTIVEQGLAQQQAAQSAPPAEDHASDRG